MMNTIVADTGTVRMPITLTTLDAFREWIHSDGVAEDTRACFLDGEVWIDMSTEQLFSHNQVKKALTITLGGLAQSQGTGRYMPDGILYSNATANLGAKPDGAYFSFDSVRSERVTFIGGAKEGVVELEGSLDIVIEVVSNSSVKKDTKKQPKLYFRAGVIEYWLIDARREPLSFQILQRGANKFQSAPERDGWLKSNVFGLEFRLVCQLDPVGQPEFVLESREG
ncbi:MAG: Uma2 family endonuclease [Planctomycetota bacterium]|nr:Uma2 family endonuclease [Planctomycetota bacterium]